MKQLYLDAFAGISGDMCLGLMVDLGVNCGVLADALRLLPLNGWRLDVHPEQRHGIGGTRVEVLIDIEQPHRTWQQIDEMLASTPLPLAVRELARKIFRRLGEAEAKVHQVSLDQVHFHEVGAADAIIDIVGTSFGLHHLNIGEVICSPLPMAQGLIRGCHGAMPLPAPATLELLCGVPVGEAHGDRELVTPTGAAIAVEIARFAPMPAMTIERIGYGVGSWELTERPNLLRGLLGQTGSSSILERDSVTVIETNIDDSLPEVLGSLLELLMAAGALDATFSPLQMKKNRPAVTLTVVSPPNRAEHLATLVLHHSSATGVRLYDTRRLKLHTEVHTISTQFGTAEVKLIFEGSKLLRIAPEHSSCVALANCTSRPLAEIYRLVTAVAAQIFGLET